MTSLFLFETSFFNAGSSHSNVYQALSCLRNVSLYFQHAVYFFPWLYKLPSVLVAFNNVPGLLTACTILLW